MKRDFHPWTVVCLTVGSFDDRNDFWLPWTTAPRDITSMLCRFLRCPVIPGHSVLLFAALERGARSGRSRRLSPCSRRAGGFVESLPPRLHAAGKMKNRILSLERSRAASGLIVCYRYDASRDAGTSRFLLNVLTTLLVVSPRFLIGCSRRSLEIRAKCAPHLYVVATEFLRHATWLHYRLHTHCRCRC